MIRCRLARPSVRNAVRRVGRRTARSRNTVQSRSKRVSRVWLRFPSKLRGRRKGRNGAGHGEVAQASTRCIPRQRETNMSHLRVLNKTKQILLCSVCKVASSDRERIRGLLDRTSMQAGEGLLIPRCHSIHTVGMQFPIDVLYLGSDGKVLWWQRNVQPGAKRTTPGYGGGDSVLELPAGGALSTEVGDVLSFQRI